MNNARPAICRLFLLSFIILATYPVLSQILNPDEVTDMSLYFRKTVTDTLDNRLGYLFGKYIYTQDSTQCYVNTEDDAYLYVFAENEVSEFINGKRNSVIQTQSLLPEFDMLKQINPFHAFTDSAVTEDSILFIVRTPFSLIKDSIEFYFSEGYLDSIMVFSKNRRIARTDFSNYVNGVPNTIITDNYSENIREKLELSKVKYSIIDKNGI